MATEFFVPQDGPPRLPLFHSYADAAQHGYDEIETTVPARFDRTRRVFQVVRRRHGRTYSRALLQVHS